MAHLSIHQIRTLLDQGSLTFPASGHPHYQRGAQVTLTSRVGSVQAQVANITPNGTVHVTLSTCPAGPALCPPVLKVRMRRSLRKKV